MADLEEMVLAEDNQVVGSVEEAALEVVLAVAALEAVVLQEVGKHYLLSF